MTPKNKNLVTNYSSAKFSWLKSGGNISHLYKVHNQVELNELFSQNDIKAKSFLGLISIAFLSIDRARE